MGVHDTVHLDRPRACSTCGKNIESVQLSREGALDWGARSQVQAGPRQIREDSDARSS